MRRFTLGLVVGVTGVFIWIVVGLLLLPLVCVIYVINFLDCKPSLNMQNSITNL